MSEYVTESASRPPRDRVILQKEWTELQNLRKPEPEKEGDSKDSATIDFFLDFLLFLMWKGIISPFESRDLIKSYTKQGSVTPELDSLIQNIEQEFVLMKMGEKKTTDPYGLTGLNMANYFMLVKSQSIDEPNRVLRYDENIDYANFTDSQIDRYGGPDHVFANSNQVNGIHASIADRFQVGRNLSDKPEAFKTGVEKLLDGLASGRIELTPFTAEQAYDVFGEVAKSSDFARTLAPFIAEFTTNALTAGSPLVLSSAMKAFVSNAPWLRNVFGKVTAKAFEKFTTELVKNLISEMAKEHGKWADAFEKAGRDAVENAIRVYVTHIFYHQIELDMEELADEIREEKPWKIGLYLVAKTAIKLTKYAMSEILKEVNKELGITKEDESTK